MQKRHSGIGQAAYSELLRVLRDDSLTEIRGTPELKTLNGRGYWYDRVRVGTRVTSRYIGEDTADLRQRLKAHRRQYGDRAEGLKQRGRLVRILRGEGYAAMTDDTGPLLGAMARLGVFRLGGTLVGTHAFRLYEGELGRCFPADETAMTQDVGIAQFQRLSFALDDRVEPSLQDSFKALDFRELPALDAHSSWRWQSGATTVEFLTASFDAEEEVRELPALGVNARALHFMNFLLAEPIQAAVIYRQGILVQIPRPERYAIHKLIVASRRRKTRAEDKSAKDRRQAAFLISGLAEDRPFDLWEAWSTARQNGPRWRRHLDRSLASLPKTRALLSDLEAEFGAITP